MMNAVKQKKFWIYFFIAFIFVILALVPSIYFYQQYQAAKQQLEKTGDTPESEKQQLLGAIGRLVILPEGEDPTIYRIDDISQLAGQRIFAKAQNGDQVVVYGIAQKVIVYRPSADKIVDIGNVAPTPTPGPTTVATPSAMITATRAPRPTDTDTVVPTETPVL